MTPKPHSRRAEILTELGADPRAIADRVVDLEEQYETLREAVREHVESAHGQYSTDKHAKLRAALSSPARES